jgi:hypothetical protein
MSSFVDFQKRGFKLPFGCNDLADALANPNPEPHSKERWKVLNGLQETERYLARHLLTPKALSYLSIDLIHKPHRVQLMHVRDALSLLLLIDGTDKGRLPRIRRFFRNAEIPPVVDVMGSISVISDTSTRILVYPLPVVAPDAAELITRVLRQGFAIAEDAQLHISSNENCIA